MDGIFCLDKPAGMTSFACCAAMRRLLKEKKVGHAGTLDPMATGVLPILVGRAAKALELLPIQEKRYTAGVRFSLTSDTLDIWGQCSPTGAPFPSRAEVEEALPAFRGEILQIPPMMSALKRDGVRLYELARQGIEVERAPRPVNIKSLRVLAYDEPAGLLTLDVACSKGTYIRTLCDDLGHMLGCGAVMASLQRTMAAGYSLDACVSLEEAQRLAAAGGLSDRLLPVESAFGALPAVRVSGAQARRFQNGGALDLDRVDGLVAGRVRVYSPDGLFLGLGEPTDGELRVRYLASV